jgi:hypothetical protein
MIVNYPVKDHTISQPFGIYTYWQLIKSVNTLNSTLDAPIESGRQVIIPNYIQPN